MAAAKWTNWIVGLGSSAVLALGVLGLAGLVFARAVVVEPYGVPQAGMAPAILPGDTVVLYKWGYTPARGDIVVFRYPLDRRYNYVQRIVGLPGDRIAFVDGGLVLNGAPAPVADRGAAEYVDHSCTSHAVRRHEEALPDGRSYATWHDPDHPSEMATLDEQVVPVGHVFTVGDNRDHSDDSRRWGFVPLDDLRGQVTRVLMSADPCGGSRPGRSWTPLQ